MKNRIISLIVIIIITTIISQTYTIYLNKKKYEAREKMHKSTEIKLLKKIEKNKISEEEKILLKNKKEADVLKKEVEKLNIDLEYKNFMKDCKKNQSLRIIEWKEVKKWYCEEQFVKKQAKTVKIDDLTSENTINDKMYSKDNFKVLKSKLFICKEVKEQYWFKSDENRCWTMMTIVWFLETQYWANWIWSSMNNVYWIKNPTDTNWLVWNWKYWEENNIIFETKEMSSYSFAYYFMKYHNHRNMKNFTERWVGWSNINYQTALEQNYDWIYSEYKSL